MRIDVLVCISLCERDGQFKSPLAYRTEIGPWLGNYLPGQGFFA